MTDTNNFSIPLPCPFCGEDAACLIHEQGLTHAQCEKCGARLPPVKGRARAIRAWNRRADPYTAGVLAGRKQVAEWMNKMARSTDTQDEDEYDDESVFFYNIGQCAAYAYAANAIAALPMPDGATIEQNSIVEPVSDPYKLASTVKESLTVQPDVVADNVTDKSKPDQEMFAPFEALADEFERRANIRVDNEYTGAVATTNAACAAQLRAAIEKVKRS